MERQNKVLKKRLLTIRGGTVHRCHGSVHTSVKGSRFDFGTTGKKNLLCSVSFHLF